MHLRILRPAATHAPCFSCLCSHSLCCVHKHPTEARPQDWERHDPPSIPSSKDFTQRPVNKHSQVHRLAGGREKFSAGVVIQAGLSLRTADFRRAAEICKTRTEQSLRSAYDSNRKQKVNQVRPAHSFPTTGASPSTHHASTGANAGSSKTACARDSVRAPHTNEIMHHASCTLKQESRGIQQPPRRGQLDPAPRPRRRALVYRMGASAAAELQPELQLPTPATHPPAISC
jgi:hypothetical protein